MVFSEGLLEDIKVLGMEYKHSIFLSDDKDLTFFHLLAECNSLGELKRIALDPFTLSCTLVILILLDFLQCDKE